MHIFYIFVFFINTILSASNERLLPNAESSNSNSLQINKLTSFLQTVHLPTSHIPASHLANSHLTTESTTKPFCIEPLTTETLPTSPLPSATLLTAPFSLAPSPSAQKPKLLSRQALEIFAPENPLFEMEQESYSQDQKIVNYKSERKFLSKSMLIHCNLSFFLKTHKYVDDIAIFLRNSYNIFNFSYSYFYEFPCYVEENSCGFFKDNYITQFRMPYAVALHNYAYQFNADFYDENLHTAFCQFIAQLPILDCYVIEFFNSKSVNFSKKLIYLSHMFYPYSCKFDKKTKIKNGKQTLTIMKAKLTYDVEIAKLNNTFCLGCEFCNKEYYQNIYPILAKKHYENHIQFDSPFDKTWILDDGKVKKSICTKFLNYINPFTLEEVEASNSDFLSDSSQD